MKHHSLSHSSPNQEPAAKLLSYRLKMPMRVLPRMLVHTLQEWFLQQHIYFCWQRRVLLAVKCIMFMTFSRARCIIITVALTLRGLQIPSVEQVHDRKAKTEVVAKDVPGKGRREHLIVTSLGRMRPPKSLTMQEPLKHYGKQSSKFPQNKSKKKISQGAVSTVVLEPLSLSKVAGSSWKKHLKLKPGWRKSRWPALTA